MYIRNRSKDKFVLILSFMSICVIGFIFLTGCKKFVEVDTPVTNINGNNVYSADATAIGVLSGIYAKMSKTSNISNGPGISTLSVFSGLSADELALFSGITGGATVAYYRNSLSVTTGGFEYWQNIYPYIFICNESIEGISKSSTLTPSVRKQLLGEAKFMRAFFYFYLVNLYGDVPLVINTDYTINVNLERSSKNDVYKQIISDLKEAQELLSLVYLDGTLINKTTERLRPNKWAATALLSRVYLYIGDFNNAEIECSTIINNAGLYALANITKAFEKNSTEAIWQLQPVSTARYVEDAALFIIPSSGISNSYPVYLNSQLINSFEFNDLRKAKWTDSVIVGSNIYRYAYKYKINTPSSSQISEYTMVLRLAEQYLIRSEARAQQDNLSGAKADLNVIRTRSSLQPTTANDKQSLLAAIIHERQTELFTEWGQRWLDLKRTSTINDVMSVVTVKKGGVWQPYQQLLPIPQTDIDKNFNLIQNSGY
jgi:starch-binding outer membrane protein, SusD/RagB family